MAPDKTVRVLSINYIGKSRSDTNGHLWNRRRGKARWVDQQNGQISEIAASGSHISKTGGDDPMTMITVQKMQDGEQ